jgi:hypothetical protein
MSLKIGAILVSATGEQYRVIECHHDCISLRRINGYTIFAYRQSDISAVFQLASAS